MKTQLAFFSILPQHSLCARCKQLADKNIFLIDIKTIPAYIIHIKCGTEQDYKNFFTQYDLPLEAFYYSWNPLMWNKIKDTQKCIKLFPELTNNFDNLNKDIVSRVKLFYNTLIKNYQLAEQHSRTRIAVPISEM